MSFSRQIALGDINNLLLEVPGYIPSYWCLPFPVPSIVAGSAPGSGSIRLFPAYIKELVTINALGVRIGTASAGNIQAAIYANNPATGRPTGPALASTASMSTASVTSVNAAVNLQLGPGLYWFATNSDNASSIPAMNSANTPVMAALIGSATQSTCLGSSSGIAGVSVAQTFGTWPDLTSATFIEVGSGSIPIVQFKIASAP